MSNDDIRSNQHLLQVAGKNLRQSADALNQVSWPPEMAGLSMALSLMRLTLQQTMNVVSNILDDL